MSRYDLIRIFALDVTADDYEDLEQILKGVVRLANRCKLEIGSEAVLMSIVSGALVSLVTDGLAKAYVLSPTAPVEEVDRVPSLDEIEQLYFFITDRGREEVSSFEGWPFDERNSLLPGWAPPDE